MRTVQILDSAQIRNRDESAIGMATQRHDSDGLDIGRDSVYGFHQYSDARAGGATELRERRRLL